MKVFVFGSNEVGRHGRGAALHARERHGATTGQGEGLQGTSYGIPTKGKNLRYALGLDIISVYVERFISFARQHPYDTFFVTAIGTGLAGYEHKDIAPMFDQAPSNCLFPEEWKPYLPGRYSYQFHAGKCED